MEGFQYTWLSTRYPRNPDCFLPPFFVEFTIIVIPHRCYSFNFLFSPDLPSMFHVSILLFRFLTLYYFLFFSLRKWSRYLKFIVYFLSKTTTLHLLMRKTTDFPTRTLLFELILFISTRIPFNVAVSYFRRNCSFHNHFQFLLFPVIDVFFFFFPSSPLMYRRKEFSPNSACTYSKSPRTLWGF